MINLNRAAHPCSSGPCYAHKTQDRAGLDVTWFPRVLAACEHKQPLAQQGLLFNR